MNTKNYEALDRNEVIDCITNLIDENNFARFVKGKQDYSGNYDEIYNSYASLNMGDVKQLLTDFYLDNVSLNGKKNIEYLYSVIKPVTNYMKFEALRVFVYEKLDYKVFATSKTINYDFVLFNDCIVVLEITSQGALTGGHISYNESELSEHAKLYDSLKVDSEKFLSIVPCEDDSKKAINKSIEQIKQSLKSNNII